MPKIFAENRTGRRRIHDERCNAYGNDCNDHTADSAYTDQPFVAELLFLKMLSWNSREYNVTQEFSVPA